MALFMILSVAARNALADPVQTDPDKDPQITKLMQEANQMTAATNLTGGVEKCDEVIAAFKERYGDGKIQVHCARTGAECLSYLMEAASKGGSTNIELSADARTGRISGKAIVLSPTWAEAYFTKGYALQDLGRIPEATASIDAALALSPLNAHYLHERGNLYEGEKNWPKAQEVFKLAADNAAFSPDSTRAAELGQARRGTAYVLVELGKLDEAEKIYEQCLAADPNDARARRELKYVRQLQAKAKPQ